MFNEHIHFFETAFIQQHGNAFTGSVFTFLVLLGDGLFTSAQTCYRTTFNKLLYFFKLVAHLLIDLWFINYSYSGFSQSSVNTPKVDFG